MRENLKYDEKNTKWFLKYYIMEVKRTIESEWFKKISHFPLEFPSSRNSEQISEKFRLIF